MRTMPSWWPCLALLSSPVLAASPDAPRLPERIELERSAATALQLLSTAPNTDEALLRLEGLMPHLGGFYLDAQGVTHVLLTDEAPAAERLTAGAVGDAVGQARSWGSTGQTTQQRLAPTRLESARFRFSELLRMREAATDVMNLSDVQTLDADEHLNRVGVGVLSEEAVQHVREYWARLGLPGEALEVHRERPLVLMSTLSSYVRPIPGGYSIRNGNFSYTTCTLGYTVYSSVLNMFGFITASHCTNVYGGVENTSFYQGNPFSFATEKLDPQFQTSSTMSGCPSGQLCRYSDSAFAGDPNYDTGAFDAVAQTVDYCSLPQTSCSTTVNSSAPVFYPHGYATAPLKGQYFEKIGQTTGWTYGQVSDTCSTKTITYNGTTRTFLCQYGVDAGANLGDSGGPVFTWDGRQNPIGGILFAVANGTFDYFVFSHYSSINAELGTMYYY